MILATSYLLQWLPPRSPAAFPTLPPDLLLPELKSLLPLGLLDGRVHLRLLPLSTPQQAL